jgi:hypothetical protein
MTVSVTLKREDEIRIVSLHVEAEWPLRKIAETYSTSNHRVKRILERHGAPIRTEGWKLEPLSEERKKQISSQQKGLPCWMRGRKMTDEHLRKMMASKLKTKRSLSEYKDLERLKILTGITSRHRKMLSFTDESRFAFIDKFYFDEAFNAIYDAWLVNDKNKWWYPSIDHKIPKSLGGCFSLDNLQFLTWFENRAKADIPQDQWEELKRFTNTKSNLFIESILESRRRSN